MKMLELYQSVLEFAGLTIDDDRAYVKVGKSQEPFLVDGKQLVIPSSNILRNFKANEMMVFHPLSEDIIKGETSVITKLRYIINIKLNVAIGVIAQNLLNLVDSPDLHGKLTPEQSEIIYKINDLDDKTVKGFTTHMMKEVNNNEDRLFSYIYLKRAGTINGIKYARVAITSFPFYGHLMKGEKYKFRTKDISALTNLFQFMFSGIDDEAEYNYGSNNDTAPFFQALMLGSYKIALRLNELIKIYGPYIEDSESLLFNLDWVDAIEGMDKYRNEIRSIPTTEVLIAPANSPAEAPMSPQQTSYPVQQPQQMTVQQAMQPQQTELRDTGRGLDFNSLKQKMNAQQQPQMQFFQPQMQPGMAMPMGFQPQQQPYTGDVLNRPQMPQGYPMQGYPMQPGMPMQQGYPMQPGMQQMPMQGYPMPQGFQMQPGMQQMPMQGYPMQGYPMQPNMQPMQPIQPQPMMPNMAPPFTR